MTQDEFLSLMPGDKVRVVPGYTDEIRRVDFIPEMERFFGTWVTIACKPEDKPESPEAGYGRVAIEEDWTHWCACEFVSRINPLDLEELI